MNAHVAHRVWLAVAAASIVLLVATTVGALWSATQGRHRELLLLPAAVLFYSWIAAGALGRARRAATTSRPADRSG